MRFIHTPVSVRQGCILSPVLFNVFLEQIMQQTLHQTKTTISVGENDINNLRFANEIDLIAGSNTGLQTLINKLVSASKDYVMEISKEKRKTMVNTRQHR